MRSGRKSFNFNLMLKIAVQDGERFNTFSHLAAALGAACGVCLLMFSAVAKHDMSRVITCSIYSISTVGIYILSVLYHASHGPSKRFFQRLDYIGIYLKIAGNYTPYMILAIQGFRGWSVLSTVWTLAAIGIFVELFFKPESRLVPNLIYLTMSSTVIPVLHILFASVPPFGFGLIMVGFLSYVVGFYFFLNAEKIPHAHGVWHMFVIGGSLCQYLCLLMYVV